MIYLALILTCVLIHIITDPVLAVIKIQAALPNPDNEADEWIEIINTGNSPINLSGMLLDDEPDAGSKPYPLKPEDLSAGAIRRFPKSETGITLNNSKQKDQAYADVIRVFSSTGEELDRLVYHSAQTNEIITPATSDSPANTTTSTPSSNPTIPTITPSPRPTQFPSSTPGSTSLPTEPKPTQNLTPVVTGSVLSQVYTPKTHTSPNPGSVSAESENLNQTKIALTSTGLGSALLVSSLIKSLHKLREGRNKLK